jgi:hypothetical protein
MGQPAPFSPAPRRGRPRLTARLALVVGLAALPVIGLGVGKKPKKTDGPYNIAVGGSCLGAGRATVKKDTITVSADVEDPFGNRGTLSVTLTVDGDHFEGDGTVLGRAANFFGRLDGYDGDKHFRGARLLCSFTDSRGRSGRLAGPLD